MKTWLSLVFIGLIFMLNAACQSLDIHLPGPRVDSPETAGKRKFALGGHASSGGNIKSTDNAGGRPPDFDTGEVRGSGTLGPYGEYGILDNLSVGLEANIGNFVDAYFVGNVKYQIFGSNWVKKEVGPSLAIWGRLGHGSSYESGDQDTTFGSGGFPWEGTLSSSLTGLGFSGGYRVNHKLLVFAGAAADKYNIASKIEQDPATDNSDPGGTYTKDFTGNIRNIGVGLRYNWRIFAMEFYYGYEEGRFNELGNFYGRAGGIKFEWLLNHRARNDPFLQKQREKEELPKDEKIEAPEKPKKKQ